METTTEDITPPSPSLSPSANPTQDYPFAALVRYWQEYGSIFRLPITQSSGWIYVINDPLWVKHVLSNNHKNYQKGLGIERVRILLGNGLMASEGEHWHSQRKMIQPMVHHSRLARLEATMLRDNQALYEQWLSQVKGHQSIDITQAMSELTLNFILDAVFSEDLANIIAKYQTNPFLVVSEDSNRNLEFARKFRELTKLVAEIIGERRKTERRPADFLSHLLDARDKKTGEPMSDKQIINEAMTLVVAGHETTASSLNWIWYLLAKYPATQRKVQQEITDVLGNRQPNLETCQQLTYTTWVIKEALRLYPPGWLLTRRSIGADKIADYPIAANSDIYISPYLVHRHPEHWPNPEAFNPERFADDAAQQRQRFAYIPFGAGPRNCLGDEIAMLEMQMHIAFMAQRFTAALTSTQPIEIEADVNLRPKQHLHINLKYEKIL